MYELFLPMCAHYESVSDKARLQAHFGIDLPSELARQDVWPGYLSTFSHPLMNQFHKPTDEKRMIVILPSDRYDDWLRASAKDSGEFLRAWPADSLQAAA